jgi:ubiquinone/menaquinone biosynthesis C-methylase UbiE
VADANGNIDVREEYDAVSWRYEDRWRIYTDRSITETLRRAPLDDAAQLLDVGCGTGALLRRLIQSRPDLWTAGIDLSVGMLAAARRSNMPRNLAAGDALHLPFRSRSFDLVISSSSLHFWSDLQSALIEIARILRPGGGVVITDWCDDYFACRICDRFLRWRDPAHRGILSAHELENLLVRTGFRVTRVDRYKISWLWGLMTAVAFKPAEANSPTRRGAGRPAPS